MRGVLKTEFIVTEDEKYPAGTPIAMRRRHCKHTGFCCNVAFLTPAGEIISNDRGLLALFGKDHFHPLKEWFDFQGAI